MSYQAIQVFAVWALLPAGLTCLATGLVLGLSSRYGVLRNRWVAVKLLINIGLTTLVPVALRPAAASAAEYGRQLAAGQMPGHPTSIFYPPIVSPIALLTAIVLAVYKPWGPIRWRRGRLGQLSLSPACPVPSSTSATRLAGEGLPDGVPQQKRQKARSA